MWTIHRLRRFHNKGQPAARTKLIGCAQEKFYSINKQDVPLSIIARLSAAKPTRLPRRHTLSNLWNLRNLWILPPLRLVVHRQRSGQIEEDAAHLNATQKIVNRNLSLCAS